MRKASVIPILLIASAAFPAAALAAEPGTNGRIAFSTPCSASSSCVVTMNPNGRGQAVINQQGDYASWSADGTALSFYLGSQLATMNADGSNVTPDAAANSPGVNPYFLDQASWSPDSRQLVFSANGEYVTGPGQQLVIVNSDGSGQPFFLTPVMQEGVVNPSWSPRDGVIAFTDGSGEIDEVAADGSNLTSVHAGSQPDFSPDGSKIVFVSASGDLWIMNSDGSGAQALLTGSPCPCRDPRFSPNGTEVVFITGSPPVYAARDGAPEPSTSTTNSIETVPAGGGNPSLTVTCSQYVLSVSWQPLVAGASPAEPTGSEQQQVCTPAPRVPKPAPDLRVRQTHRRSGDGTLSVRIWGRLLLPAGVDPRSGCAGRITMWFIRSRRQIATRVVSVGRACRYSVNGTFSAGASAPNSVVVRFDGNSSMRQSQPYRARV